MTEGEYEKMRDLLDEVLDRLRTLEMDDGPIDHFIGLNRIGTRAQVVKVKDKLKGCIGRVVSVVLNRFDPRNRPRKRSLTR